MSAMRHVLDGSALHDRLSALDGIAAALSFPDYFGRNLDALRDCLIDLSWLPAGQHVLVWQRSGVLRGDDPQAYQRIVTVLDQAVEENPEFRYQLS
jgi:RNAse (barnase) inhibitor barstar